MNTNSDIPEYDPTEGRLPPGAGTFGMILLIASLAMLFFAVIALYFVVRLQLITENPPTPPLGQIHIPILLWLSSLVIVSSSVLIQYALSSVKMGHRFATRNAIAGAAACSLVFLGLQIPALYQLIEQHKTIAQNNVYLYAIIALLVIIHAAHVVGGLIPMYIITRNTILGHYNEQHYAPMKYMTMYWHFIGAVWLIMFFSWVMLG